MQFRLIFNNFPWMRGGGFKYAVATRPGGMPLGMRMPPRH